MSMKRGGAGVDRSGWRGHSTWGVQLGLASVCKVGPISQRNLMAVCGPLSTELGGLKPAGVVERRRQAGILRRQRGVLQPELLASWGRLLKEASHGLRGALAIEPDG